MKPEDILTPEQLAERLQIGVNWVYEKSRSRGEHSGIPLPVLRCGRYLRFHWPKCANGCGMKSTNTPTRSAANSKNEAHPLQFPLQCWRVARDDCCKLLKSGAPGETRTPDPLLRRQTLYPTELRALSP